MTVFHFLIGLFLLLFFYGIWILNTVGSYKYFVEHELFKKNRNKYKAGGMPTLREINYHIKNNPSPEVVKGLKKIKYKRRKGAIILILAFIVFTMAGSIQKLFQQIF